MVKIYFRFLVSLLFLRYKTHAYKQPSKIQAITTSQLFWHEKIDIGSITLHTAGGNITFELGNFTKIKHYVNLWLYKIETSDSNWM